ncbi:hypothetical protein AVEN_26220-1 [Araneus ventricosus]|uniref:DUF7041 domain-containing protein n=1 Tax=Araneus ventricosus TaxID=182803 RepID=A0A4Y2ALK3_ARAVE|nr:hypothetical protein AVEN_26220-1 [Araneus ventricosus]
MATPETAAVVIPPFIQPDPELWFHMLESTFELASPKPITESKTKYNYVVAHLPPEIATVVRGVIIQPDPSDPYTDLKSKIIACCSESKTQEIRRLLAGESLGDLKPSKLLRVIKRRAENHNIDDSLLLELFKQAMPVPVRTILASISPITSDKKLCCCTRCKIDRNKVLRTCNPRIIRFEISRWESRPSQAFSYAAD